MGVAKVLWSNIVDLPTGQQVLGHTLYSYSNHCSPLVPPTRPNMESTVLTKPGQGFNTGICKPMGDVNDCPSILPTICSHRGTNSRKAKDCQYSRMTNQLSVSYSYWSKPFKASCDKMFTTHSRNEQKQSWALGERSGWFLTWMSQSNRTTCKHQYNERKKKA